jgi:hypothetical protein
LALFITESILFFSAPHDYNALSNCLTELKKTKMKIILIGVGRWDQTRFAKLCKDCHFGLNAESPESKKWISKSVIQSLRETCSVNI